MQSVLENSTTLSVVALCDTLALPRATFYRRQKPKKEAVKRAVPRALSADERRDVLAVLHEPRFADQAPAQVVATLLDEGRHIASERTMYRILDENKEVRERRNQLKHPNYAAPQLMLAATPESQEMTLRVAMI